MTISIPCDVIGYYYNNTGIQCFSVKSNTWGLTNIMLIQELINSNSFAVVTNVSGRGEYMNGYVNIMIILMILMVNCSF